MSIATSPRKTATLRARVLIVFTALLTTSCATAPGPRHTLVAGPTLADLVLHNGTIVTLDGTSTVAEAVAVRGATILAVGTTSEVAATIGPDTTVVNLEGRTVLPGFVDPHQHYMNRGEANKARMLEDQTTLLSWGRTTVGIPNAQKEHLEVLRELRSSGDVKLRIHAYVPWNTSCGERVDINIHDYVFDRSAESRLAVAGVKVFMDGGSCRGPAVSFNFDDAPPGVAPPGWTGHGDLFMEGEDFADLVSEVDARGGQVVTHAIGDRAVEEALYGYKLALDGGPNPNGHRIDHTTFIRPEIADNFARLNIPAVVWGIFYACGEPDQGWASFLNAEQLSWLRRHRMLLDENPRPLVAFHSDAPATNGSPFHQLLGLTEMAELDSATGRECPAPPWLAGHAVTVPEALQMMTIWPAKVMGISEDVGSIEPGKYADLVVLQRNPLDQRGFDLLDNSVTATIANGETVWCQLASWCTLFA